MIKLTDAFNHNTIFINFESIEYMYRVGMPRVGMPHDPMFTAIYHRSGKLNRVEETPEEIMKIIKVPTNDDYLLRDAIKTGGYLCEEDCKGECE